MTETQTPPDASTPSSRLERLAAFAHRRRRLVIATWLVALVATIALAPRLAGDYTADYWIGGTDSTEARELIEDRFGGYSAEGVDVVWEAPAGADSRAVRAQLDPFLAEAERLEGIGSVEPARISAEGTIGTAELRLDRPNPDVPDETGERLIALAEETTGSGLEIALGGQVISNVEGIESPEVIGLSAALVVLLIAFGSLVAAGLPLAVALFGLGVSAPLTGVLAQVATVPDWAPLVAAMMGIGVGIDYALLVLTRFRSALAAGSETPLALGEALTTAGRSVLIAGSTVIVSMLGLFLMGLDYMNGVALSASLAVLVMMVAAVTLLPALLAYAGPGVNRLRLPLIGGRSENTDGARTTFAERWSRGVQRRPWTALAAGLAVLIALAAPVLGMRLGFPDAGNDTRGSQTRTAYDLNAEGFGPGTNGPLLLAAELPGPEAAGELRAAAQQLREVPGVASVSAPEISDDGSAGMLSVVPTTSPASDETENLVHELRDEVLPATLGDAGIATSLGGLTANVVDQSDYVGERLPLFIAGVVILSLLLLLAAFRAPLIAVKAGVMNLLSVGAAYGVTALFAQGGFASSLLGIDTEVPIPPFMPVMMFAILFGLSMDYEVFLISRMREVFLRTRSPATAVTEGLARSARVITAAAAIMVVVFLAFAVADDVFLRLMGIGMATAILVDATVVRMVLVPAAMQLLGRASWWTPAWLERALPRLEHEPGLARPGREAPAET